MIGNINVCLATIVMLTIIESNSVRVLISISIIETYYKDKHDVIVYTYHIKTVTF